jgi:hypothetical protein
MTPERAISLLDRSLAQHGENTQLGRVLSPTDPYNYLALIPLRAFVRPLAQVGLVSVITSPTQTINGGWAELAPVAAGDPDVPRKNDKIVVSGRQRNIESVRPFYIDTTLVRIEMDATG